MRSDINVIAIKMARTSREVQEEPVNRARFDMYMYMYSKMKQMLVSDRPNNSVLHRLRCVLCDGDRRSGHHDLLFGRRDQI